MELWEAKICSILFLGIGSLIVGIIPLWFATRRTQWPLLISSFLCFGGGVLLATSIVHMLPEVREVMPAQFKEFSEIIFCVGFFILYFIDEIVHLCYGEINETNFLTNLSGGGDHNHSCVGSSNNRRHSVTTRHTYGSVSTDETHPLFGDKQYAYNPSFYKARSDSDLFLEDNRPPSQMCHVGHQEPCANTLPVANIGLLIALSTHAVLEGLVVGLEPEVTKVLLLLGAIASHKLVVGFCLGIELASNLHNTKCRHVMSILIFTIGSVAGIALGMLVSNIPDDFTSVVTPILQGLAGGTLLYVTVSEIIPRERARWHQQHSRKSAGIYQFVSVALGFSTMTLLTKYTDFQKDCTSELYFRNG